MSLSLSMGVTTKAGTWLSRKQAAAYLHSLGWSVGVRTMENWAANNNAGGGPAFTRFGWKTVKYLKEDLDTWSEARKARVG